MIRTSPQRDRSPLCQRAVTLSAALMLIGSAVSARAGIAQSASQTAVKSIAADSADTARVVTPSKRTPWYERLSLRGYTQVRYNNLFRSNADLTCAQCDRSIGNNGGLFIRRARVVLSGDVSDRLYIYIQPDFGAEVSGNQNFAQIRDAYFDVALDAAKEFRIRVGQSKVPYGWENLQSSSNRITFDRDDAINSAISNERDLGVMLYWAPSKIRKRFKMLVDSGLKGTGDYGVVGIAAFNGQGANKPEANDNLHSVLRVSYPFQLSNGQFIEVGVQGLTGKYVLTSRTTGLDAPNEFSDNRVGASFILYPQPFGLQAEWNAGRGPEYSPSENNTRVRSLNGGYVQTMYRIRSKGQVMIPYVRAQKYDGGKKFELDARHYRVRELEGGIEWLPMAAVELTAAYVKSDRTYEDMTTPSNRQKGHMVRLQAQFNY